jgi:hypothetical protein
LGNTTGGVGVSGTRGEESGMTRYFRVANTKTGVAIRIVTENTNLPVSIREELRRHVLGAEKAKALGEKHRHVKARAAKAD